MAKPYLRVNIHIKNEVPKGKTGPVRDRYQCVCGGQMESVKENMVGVFYVCI
jgi:hypothetical protein